MTPASGPILSETAAALCLMFIFLVPFAGAGLALINTGLGRARSAAHQMMSSLCAVSIAAVVFFVWGFTWEGFQGGPAHILNVGGKGWDWIGAQPLFLRHVALDGSPASLAALLGMMSVGLAALIPLGSGADRWRLSATCVSTALLAESHTRSSRTGPGAADGSRSLGRITGSAADLWTQEGRERFRRSAG